MKKILSLFFLSFKLQALELQVGYDARLRSLDTGEEKQIKAHEKTTVSSHAILVSSEKHLPLVLLPQISSSDVIDLEGIDSGPIIEKAVTEEASKMTSHLLKEILAIQKIMEQKRFEEAHQKMLVLKQTYRQVAFLNIIHSGILLSTGRRQEALKLAEEAMKEMPHYHEGKVFLEKIKKGGN